MSRLKSRQKFIPNGFRFYQPETKWYAPNGSSFQIIVNALVAHRTANPFLAKQHGWQTDPNAVADEVDEFNARICEQMGWMDYVQEASGGSPPPKFLAPSPSDQSKLAAVAGRVKKIWSGVRTLNDWIDSGDPPVPAEQAEGRAAACAACLKNTPGDFTTWFTQPAADAIKRQQEKLADRKLATSKDELINVCSVCLCPLKLKVHTPLAYINAHLSDPVLRELEQVPGCWMVEERKA
jgi:hypothetical protein